VRRTVTEKFADPCIVPTVKHGGGSIMIWSCFGGSAVGDLSRIDGILVKERYNQTLQRYAIPSGMRLIGRGFTFQEDNDPKHSSRLWRNYLSNQERLAKLKMMEWPAQSPDLILRKIAKMSEENYNVLVPSTPLELKNIADCAVSNLIPEKSKRQYEKCYSDFRAGLIRII
jgi:hypothetical protein